MEVVQSTCPGCKRTLNIPAEWTGKTVKCKFCGCAMQVRPVAVTPASRPVPTAIPSAAPVPMAAPVPELVPAAAPMPTWEPLPSANGLPEYTPPVAATAPMAVAPAPRSGGYVSAFDTRERYTGRGSYSGPRNRGWIKYAVLGLLFVGLGGGTIAVLAAKPGWFKSSPTTEPTQVNNAEGTATAPPEPAASGTFPRRMLAISVHSYLYANPLHNGDTSYAMDDRRSGTDGCIRQLAERWRVPKEQLYHLTDARLRGEAASTGKAKKDEKAEPPKRLSKSLPLKMVIEGTVSQFLDTTRAQDRIVIVFCGHAIEKKGETYLVPLEGDFDDVESLIPLKWFYEKLGACPAQEKIVIYDVCRFHAERGIERPHPGPMSEALEKALHESPDGVTVITSCSKGEQSMELDSYQAPLSFDRPGVKGREVPIHGSFFLSMFHAASLAGVLAPDRKLSAPGDEIPVERLTGWMGDKLAEVVRHRFAERTQTMKVTLKRRSEAVPFNASEPMPGRFEYPMPPPSADPKAVMAIVREIQLPPIKSFREDAPPPSISDVLPFSQEALKDYLAGELMSGEKPNEFQQAIFEAIEEMRRQGASGSGSGLPDEFFGETDDKRKEEFRKAQEIPARVEAILQDALDKLEQVADQKDKQAKRWQVHYDYALAQIKLRICYVNQYNLALANVRGGKLPDRKDGQEGYRLSGEVTLDKNTPSDKKEMFNDARKTLAEIIKEHPKTPWALLAKSDRTVAIGLRLVGASKDDSKGR